MTPLVVTIGWRLTTNVEPLGRERVYDANGLPEARREHGRQPPNQEVVMPTEPPPGAGRIDADVGGGAVLAPSAEMAGKLADETRVATTIYGIIVSSAVMATVHEQTVAQLAVAVLVTLVVYWAAERYARVMARRIVHAPALGWPGLRLELGHGWELVTASFLPLGVLVGSSLLGASVSGAVFAALACGTVIMSVAGWQVGRQAGLRPFGCLLSAICAGAFGAVMILLKALLH